MSYCSNLLFIDPFGYCHNVITLVIAKLLGIDIRLSRGSISAHTHVCTNAENFVVGFIRAW